MSTFIHFMKNCRCEIRFVVHAHIANGPGNLNVRLIWINNISGAGSVHSAGIDQRLLTDKRLSWQALCVRIVRISTCLLTYNTKLQAENLRMEERTNWYTLNITRGEATAMQRLKIMWNIKISGTLSRDKRLRRSWWEARTQAVNNVRPNYLWLYNRRLIGLP